MKTETSSPAEGGTTVASPPVRMTRERMRWYCDALETAARADGTFIVAEPTIHTDDEYAKAQGLSGIIADGMISTNLISSLLYGTYGLDYLAAGSLDTKFIRPVYEDEDVSAHARVVSREGDRVSLEVWCAVGANADVPVTVGLATVQLGGAV